YFACVGHEGEVVQCLDGRRRPTTLTCSPTPDPSEAPSRSITTTPSPCAIPYRSALRLHPTNPRYFQDVATSAPVLIASYANVVPTTTDPAFDYVATIDLMYSKDIHYARVWHFLAFADDPDSVFWPWVKYAGSAPACYDTSKEKWDLRVNGSDKIHSPDDLDYWPRMRGIQGVQPGAIPYASDRCITSEIMLFVHATANIPDLSNSMISDVMQRSDAYGTGPGLQPCMHLS